MVSKHYGDSWCQKHLAYQAVIVTHLNIRHLFVSEAERAEGWQLLFDGKTTDHWLNEAQMISLSVRA